MCQRAVDSELANVYMRVFVVCVCVFACVCMLRIAENVCMCVRECVVFVCLCASVSSVCLCVRARARSCARVVLCDCVRIKKILWVFVCLMEIGAFRNSNYTYASCHVCASEKFRWPVML